MCVFVADACSQVWYRLVARWPPSAATPWGMTAALDEHIHDSDLAQWPCPFFSVRYRHKTAKHCSKRTHPHETFFCRHLASVNVNGCKILLKFRYVCKHVHFSSRTVTQIFTKLSMLIPWDQKENTAVSKLGNIARCSCSSGSKHDIRTTCRPKLFVSKTRLQEQTAQRPTSVLDSSPGEYGFCGSKTK